MAMHDLVLRGGRVIDPAHGIDGPADVALLGIIYLASFVAKKLWGLFATSSQVS